MKTQKIFIMLLGIAAGCFNAFAKEPSYYQVFFDNSLMEKSWFYSESSYDGESFVLNVTGKLPVAEQPVFTPGNSLELKYKSAPGGDWSARLNFPKVRGQDHIQQGEALSMRVFVESPTLESELPEVAITLKDGSSSEFLPFADYLDNFHQGEWLHLQIPLTDFEKNDGQSLEWDHSKEIVSIVFRQASTDGRDHRLFLDQVELLPEIPGNINLSAPVLTSAKGFDRHVDLKWEPVNVDEVKYVKIYRSEDGDKFLPVGIQNPMASNRYADFTGVPDKTYYYKISLLDADYQETDLSEAVEVKTHSMSDSELMDMVQEAAFRYYWEGAEPNSGLARENIPGRKDMIATGASGFGLMALVVGSERGFISREELIDRLDKITTFIEKGDRFHGALSHFMDGPTGKVEPFFGKYDNGGDLVETSFFMQGLLVARQYLSKDNAREKALRKRMSAIWEAVEWNWYKQYEDSPFLYWHWSPDHAWHINHKLIGWNETMITYFVGIASPSFGIDPSMYYSGWASQDSIALAYRSNWGKTPDGSAYSNGNTYYGVNLDVGVSNGGPLFFIHYSFMGLDPRKMEDQYTNYFKNNQAIAKINYRYCCQNPGNYYGYGPQCWGLTASDGPWGYKAREPILRMDDGTIAPTGAIASFPYLPEESMEALKFFYRDCGHFLWGEYGFRDAFNLTEDWCANIYMGLNQAPMTVMIENHRTGLIWDLFMSAPEVQEGLEAIKKSEMRK
ncbi:glucoamylase family protein [Marinilabilia rubra]|uniref:Glycoamylase-like domain-containing protein n=1 Tax=Marinilabilia rubra TaxID=2162893 RepID=A0A2U2B672_9BACT|nr:glucoamylase family protein [Marinilabilia rubra]PWD98534.1 hypothetical protein DDZ16_14950 [Marinilabilia rubra]